MNKSTSPFNPTALSGSQPAIQPAACPPESVWKVIAQANPDPNLPPEHSPETTMAHLNHAAQCRPCAELLAAATACYAAPEPETPEEAAFLAQLATSTPAAQLALAHKLGAPRLDSETWVPTPEESQPEELQPTFTLPKPRRRFAVWTTRTTAVLALCALTIFLVRALRPPSDNQLLVLAYNRNRLSELRLPGTAAVALASPTRGPDTRQFESIELLKAKTRAQEQFEHNPNDPRVRQFRGEVYIVQHDPEAARRDFEMAEALDPNLPRLKFDLATAYFELAESDPTNNVLDYPRAIDLFMQYLQQVHQSDPTALFDLGLCWERQSVVSEAIKNFEAALALERDPAWRAEIQRHLSKLKALTALDLSPEQLEATLTPQHFLTLTTESPGQYELYLDAATRKWLPARTPTAAVSETGPGIPQTRALQAAEKNDYVKGTASAVPLNPLGANGALAPAGLLFACESRLSASCSAPGTRPPAVYHPNAPPDTQTLALHQPDPPPEGRRPNLYQPGATPRVRPTNESEGCKPDLSCPAPTPTNLRHPERREGPLYFIRTTENLPVKPTPNTANPDTDPNLEPALQKLAQWGLTHHDRWLTDMLRQPQTPANHLATQTLAQAVTASAAGKADDALAASALAITQFRAAHNHPGQLRAQAEHIYALQRTLNSKQCDTESLKELKDPTINENSWLTAQILLEHATCSFMLGAADSALQTSEMTAPFAFTRQLDSVGLRANAFVVADERRLSQLREAWAAATDSLPRTFGLYSGTTRRYQFIYDMSQIADGLGLKWTKTGCSEAAFVLAKQIGNLQIEAQAAEELALDESSIGRPDDAQQHLRSAQASLLRLGDAKTAALFRNVWEIDQAVIESQKDGPSQPLRTLKSNERVFHDLKVFESREKFYDEFARLLRQTGNSTESLEKAQIAIGSAEQRLSDLKSEPERHAWEEQSEGVYQTAALDLLAIGKPLQALAVWNRFQTKPYANIHKTEIHESTFAEASDPEVPLPGRQRLTIAKLEDTYIEWFHSGDPATPITAVTVNTPPVAIQQESTALERLCADPRSNAADISLIGSMLDRELLSPLDKELDPSKTLELDLDRSLQHLPFAAIMHKGQFLGIERPLIYLQRTGTAQDSPSNPKDAETLTPNRTLVILHEPKSILEATIPETYDESTELLRLSRSASFQNVRLERTGTSVSFIGGKSLQSALSRAELIHYTGHGIEAQDPTPSTTGQSYDKSELQTGSLKQCRLAVMAACRTGAKREFQSGNVPALVRTLLDAGARRVLATQWDVDSRATHDIMVIFYRRLASKQAFPDALHNAQLAIAASPGTQHPYFWAPFQLIQATPISAKGNY